MFSAASLWDYGDYFSLGERAGHGSERVCESYRNRSVGKDQ